MDDISSLRSRHEFGVFLSLRWRHNGQDSVSNHQPHHCFLNRLFGCRSKKTSKLRVTGFCAVNSPGTGEFPAQMASNAEYVSIWWRHHVISYSIWYPGSHDIPCHLECRVMCNPWLPNTAAFKVSRITVIFSWEASQVHPPTTFMKANLI